MGLFGGYSKAGPGVDKDGPKKKGIFLYFELLIRKFWKIVQANLLYCLFSLPMILLLYTFAPIPQDFIIRLVPDAATDDVIMSTMQMGFRAMFSIGLFSLWGSGPASAGYAYLLRSFSREQHTWILSDFWAKFKENFKQGIIVSIADIVILLLSTNAIFFYFANFIQTGSIIWLFICYMTFLVLLLYTFVHYYIYQIMITFECSLTQLYRNSIIFAFAKLPMNVVLTVIALALVYVIFIVVNPMIAITLSFAIWVSLIAFPIAFYASRAIKKNLLTDDVLVNKEDDYERICED